MVPHLSWPARTAPHVNSAVSAKRKFQRASSYNQALSLVSHRVLDLQRQAQTCAINAISCNHDSNEASLSKTWDRNHENTPLKPSQASSGAAP
jgi:hypothetical protein